jgi:prophage antirepressor-like protein
MRTIKNEVIPFNFDTHQVRTILITNQIYFVAKDVCDILDIKHSDQAVRALDDSQRLTTTIQGSGQGYRMWLVNESGLYALLFKSRKPEAQKFQLWVTNEVLPSIRKTGTYSPNPKGEFPQLQLELAPQETIRVIPNELYEELMTIESKTKRLKLMKLYKAIAAKGQTL